MENGLFHKINAGNQFKKNVEKARKYGQFAFFAF